VWNIKVYGGTGDYIDTYISCVYIRAMAMVDVLASAKIVVWEKHTSHDLHPRTVTPTSISKDCYRYLHLVRGIVPLVPIDIIVLLNLRGLFSINGSSPR